MNSTSIKLLTEANRSIQIQLSQNASSIKPVSPNKQRSHIQTKANPYVKHTIHSNAYPQNSSAMNMHTNTETKATKKLKKEDLAIRSLLNKNDLRVWQGMIFILTGENKERKYQPINDLGKGTWGKIDYLVNHLGYDLHLVAEWPPYIPPRYEALLELSEEQAN
jgi:hypothetical protein